MGRSDPQLSAKLIGAVREHIDRGDVGGLSGAAEAVLDLADTWTATAESLDRAADALEPRPRAAQLRERAQAHENHARAIRKAIAFNLGVEEGPR
jgi:hypothetical protein